MSQPKAALPRTARHAKRRPPSPGGGTPNPTSPEITTQIHGPFVDIDGPTAAPLDPALAAKLASIRSPAARIEAAEGYLVASTSQGVSLAKIAATLNVQEIEIASWFLSTLERLALYQSSLVAAAGVFDRLGRATIKTMKKGHIRTNEVRYDFSVANSYFREADGLRRLSESVGRKLHSIPAAKQKAASTAAIRDLKATIRSRETMAAEEFSHDPERAAALQAELDRIYTEVMQIVNSLPEALHQPLADTVPSQRMRQAFELGDASGARVFLPQFRAAAEGLRAKPGASRGDATKPDIQPVPEPSAAPTKQDAKPRPVRIVSAKKAAPDPIAPLADVAPAAAAQTAQPAAPVPRPIDMRPLAREEANRLTHDDHTEIQEARRAGGEMAVFPILGRLRTKWRLENERKVAAARAAGRIVV